MVVLWICLWTLAAIGFFTSWKNDTIRWSSALAFFGGFGGLSVFVEETLAPYLSNQFIGRLPGVESVLHALIGVSASFGHYLAPFSLLMFALRYTNSCLLKNFSKTRITLVAFLPVFLMYMLFPVYPEFRVNYVLLTLWAGPYILLSDIMLICSCLLEKHKRLKTQKILTCLIVVPTTFCALITNFVLRVFGIEQIWRYNTIVILLAFFAVFYFFINYDFLGIKMRFEKVRLESAMRAMTSGATTLNHSFKSELGKIHILADRIQRKAKQVNQIEINTDACLVSESADHMLKMVARIQNKLQEIVLDEQPHDLQSIIERTLASLSPFFEMKGIQLRKNYSNPVKLLCDEVHLQEILSNICKNAIEAMPYAGQLQIEVYNTKIDFVIAIKDNGCGIPKTNLDKVIEPFFTTKNRKTNYGLGLSYCYNVMQKHGGSLEIQSKLNQGTLVTLHFPKNKVLTSFDDAVPMEVLNENNQSAVS